MRHFVSSFTTMDNKNKRLAGQLQLHKLYKLDFKSSLSHCFGSVSKFSIGETWCVLDFGSLDREFEVDENLSSGIHDSGCELFVAVGDWTYQQLSAQCDIWKESSLRGKSTKSRNIYWFSVRINSSGKLLIECQKGSRPWKPLQLASVWLDFQIRVKMEGEKKENHRKYKNHVMSQLQVMAEVQQLNCYHWITLIHQLDLINWIAF